MRAVSRVQIAWCWTGYGPADRSVPENCDVAG